MNEMGHLAARLGQEQKKKKKTEKKSPAECLELCHIPLPPFCGLIEVGRHIHLFAKTVVI